MVFTSGIVDEAPARSPTSPVLPALRAGVEPGVHGAEPELTHCWALRNQPSGILCLSRTGTPIGVPAVTSPHLQNSIVDASILRPDSHQVRSQRRRPTVVVEIFVAFVECL